MSVCHEAVPVQFCQSCGTTLRIRLHTSRHFGGGVHCSLRPLASASGLPAGEFSAANARALSGLEPANHHRHNTTQQHSTTTLNAASKGVFLAIHQPDHSPGVQQGHWPGVHWQSISEVQPHLPSPSPLASASGLPAGEFSAAKARALSGLEPAAWCRSSQGFAGWGELQWFRSCRSAGKQPVGLPEGVSSAAKARSLVRVGACSMVGECRRVGVWGESQCFRHLCCINNIFLRPWEHVPAGEFPAAKAQALSGFNLRYW